MRLKELVQVLPDFRDPFNDLLQRRIASASFNLPVNSLAPKVAAEEALDRLHVVGTQHPTEVMVQLQVGGRARRLVHGASAQFP